MSLTDLRLSGARGIRTEACPKEKGRERDRVTPEKAPESTAPLLLSTFSSTVHERWLSSSSSILTVFQLEFGIITSSGILATRISRLSV